MKNYKSLQNGSDIRGIAMDNIPNERVNLDEQAIWDLSAAFALWLSDFQKKPKEKLCIALGRDSRLSGERLLHIAASSLKKCKVKVFDCEMASTPAMFMATIFKELKADAAIMLTASHLPQNRNGMKFFTNLGGLGKAEIKEIVNIAENEDFGAFHIEENLPKFDLMDIYCKHLRNLICKELNKNEEEKPLLGLKIAVDAGNGAGGFYVDKVLKPLGADCSGSQFLEPDGHFPNHQPNPENKEAMNFICEAVKNSKSDLGLIFDTDVDRASAVASNGKAIDRNAIVALSAILAAEGHKNPLVITDSITSTQLHTFLEEKGINHLRFKRGYKNVIDEGLRQNKLGKDCVLAIETSGHAAMAENYFLDDGAYLATKIVIKAAILKKQGLGIESCIESLKEPKEAKEFRLPLYAEDFSNYADKVIKHIKNCVEAETLKGFSLDTPNFEGVRVLADENYGNGWFLIRKSLHEPLMPLNIESSEEGGVEKIKKAVYALLKDFDKLDKSLL